MLKYWITVILSIQFAYGPAAHSATYASGAKAIEKWFAQEQALAGSKLTSFKSTGKNGEPINGLMISGGKHDGYVVLQGSNKAVEMKRFNNLKSIIQTQKMNREKIMNGLIGKNEVGTSFIAKFGPESLGFFLALGAIQYSKMILDPSNNPMGVYQHLESQTHPLTHISFAAFMYANGVASPILQSIIDPKNKISKSIPYLGMSVGLLASNLVHEVSALLDGKMEKCIADLEKQAKGFETIATSCDKAFESWSEYSMDYLISMVPTAMSMVVATIGATTLENLVIKKAIVKMGWEVAIMPLLPGANISAGLTIARWSAHVVGNIIPFVVLDEAIGKPISNSMSMYTQSANFKYLQTDIMSELVAAKASGWSEEKSLAVMNRMIKSNQLFRNWKTLNMQKVQEGYASWLSKVSELASNYNLNKYVYTEFIKRADPTNKRDAHLTLMRRPAPLFGVNQKVSEQSPEMSIFDNPSGVMEKQLATIIEVTEQWSENAFRKTNRDIDFEKNSVEFKNVISIATRLNEIASKAMKLTQDLKDVQELFHECEKIGKIFELMNKNLGLNNLHPGLYPGTVDDKLRVDKNTDAYRILSKFRSAFGNPFPLFQRGALFFAALETLPSVRSNSLALKSIERSGGLYGLRPAQTAFMNMFFGIKEDSQQHRIFEPDHFKLPLIEIGAGIAKMNPPRLVENKLDIKVLYEKDVRKKDLRVYSTLLNTPVEYKGLRYENFYDFALENWSQLFFVRNLTELNHYWDKSILPLYQDSWFKLEKQYHNFVKGMYDQVQRDGRSFENQSPLYNGALNEIFLEMKYYNLILGEIARSVNQKSDYFYSTKSNFSALPKEKLLDKIFDPIFGYKDPQAENLPILSALDINSRNLVLFDYYSQHPFAKKDFLTEAYPNRNLKFQEEIIADFESMKKLIRQVNFIDKGSDHFFIESSVTNKDIIKIRDEITNKYQGWIDSRGPVSNLNALNPTTKQAYKIALISLKILIGELANYALIANELNYMRSDGEPGKSGQKNPECVTTSAGAQMGPGGLKGINNKKCN